MLWLTWFALIMSATTEVHASFQYVQRVEGSKKTVIFVHGLWGDPENTFATTLRAPEAGGPVQPVSWPRLMASDVQSVRGATSLSHYSTATLGYPANYSGSLSVPEASSILLTELFDSGLLDDPEVQLFFVAHSMGGLVVKDMLLNGEYFKKERLVNRTEAVFLIAVPAKGAPIADLASGVLPSVISGRLLLDARTLRDNTYLISLQNSWDDFQRLRAPDRAEVFCAFELKKTKGIMVVPREYVDTSCDERPRAENEDHFSIVKPKQIASDNIYGWVRGRLADLELRRKKKSAARIAALVAELKKGDIDDEAISARLDEERRTIAARNEESRVNEARKLDDSRRAAETKAEEERRAAEAKRLEDERRAAEVKAAEERRMAEVRRLDDERRAAETKAEEERRAAEAKNLEDERRAAEVKAAEERRIAEVRRLDDERRTAETKAEEVRRAAEAKNLEDERRAAEVKATEERRVAEALKLAEERQRAIVARRQEAILKLGQLGFEQELTDTGCDELAADADKAVAACSKVIDAQKKAELAFYRRATLFQNKKSDPSRAINDLSVAIKMQPDYLQAVMARRRLYDLKGKPELAAKDVEQVIQLTQNSSTALLYTGILHNYRSETDQAISAFTKYIEMHPTSATGYANRGWQYLVGKRAFDEAIIDTSKAIELRPSGEATIYNNRGLAYVGRKKPGDEERAVADFCMAVRLNPSSPAAINLRRLDKKCPA
jgi:pimeloyl-ACP methyl ester carboxylesterase